MDSTIERLEKRIAALERDLERLNTTEGLFALSASSGDLATSLGLDIGEIYASHTGEGTKIFKAVHDNIDTYPDAFGYLNANRTDPQAGTTGAFDHGAYWDVNNFVSMVCYKNNIDFYIKNSGTGRYTLEMSYSLANFNVPIDPATLADARAPNNTIYYSSTQSKLVFKDSGGTVRNLY